MKLEKISSNMMVAMVSRVITALLALAIVGLLTRYLGRTGYGQYSTVISYMMIFITLADLGIYTLFLREVSKPGVDESKISSNFFSLRLATVLIVVLIANVIRIFLPYPSVVKTGILIVSLFGVFSSLSQVIAGIFQKYLTFYIVSISDIITSLIQIVVVFVSIKANLGLYAFLSAVAISSGAQFVFTFLLSQRYVRTKFAFDWELWKKIFKTALPVAVSVVFTLIYFRLDTIMISLMKPIGDVGVYNVATKVLEMIVFFPSMYASLVMPALAKYSCSDKNQFLGVFKKTFDIFSVFAVIVVAGVLILADEAVSIIGGVEFLSSALPLRIIAPAIGMIFLGNLGGRTIIVLNLQKYGMWIYLTGAVFNFVANLFLIPKFSYNGAAFSTLVTEVIVTALLFILIKKKAGYSAGLKVFFKSLFSGLLAMLPFLIIRGLNPFIAAFVGVLIYFSSLYLIKGFILKDIKEIFSSKVPGEIEITQS